MGTWASQALERVRGYGAMAAGSEMRCSPWTFAEGPAEACWLA